jgi:aminopeptidase N
MNENNPTPASRAQRPDLDWSQVRETVLLLDLAVTQIAWSMRDGDESVNSLTTSFTTMVENAQAIEAALDEIPAGMARDLIAGHAASILSRTNEAIIAFQFYDKLTQRLNHLTHALDDMGSLIGTPQRLYNPFEWSQLQQMIRSRYTSKLDQDMFDSVLAGEPIERVLELAQQQNRSREEQDGGEIELF